MSRRIQEAAGHVNKDYQIGEYQCLVGRQFAVGDEIFVVRELTSDEDQTFIRANSERDSNSLRTFVITEVLERLLVEEEIELFNLGYFSR